MTYYIQILGMLTNSNHDPVIFELVWFIKNLKDDNGDESHLKDLYNTICGKDSIFVENEQ